MFSGLACIDKYWRIRPGLQNADWSVHFYTAGLVQHPHLGGFGAESFSHTCPNEPRRRSKHITVRFRRTRVRLRESILISILMASGFPDESTHVGASAPLSVFNNFFFFFFNGTTTSGNLLLNIPNYTRVTLSRIFICTACGVKKKTPRLRGV